MDNDALTFDRVELTRRANEYEARERAERALLEDTVKRFVRRNHDLEKRLDAALLDAARERERGDAEHERANLASADAAEGAERANKASAAFKDVTERLLEERARADEQCTRLGEAVARLEEERARANRARAEVLSLETTLDELQAEMERLKTADDRVVHLHVNVTSA